MHKQMEAICSALDALSASVISGWNGEQTFVEAFGWNCPAMTRHDLAAIPKQLSTRLRALALEEIDSDILLQIQGIPAKLVLLQAHTVPQLYAGNCAAASAAFFATMDSVRERLSPFFSWQTIQDNKAMPAQLARRLRSLQAELDQICPNKEQLT